MVDVLVGHVDHDGVWAAYDAEGWRVLGRGVGDHTVVMGRHP